MNRRRSGRNPPKKSEEMYANVVELAPDGIVMTDMTGIITFCNTATLRLTGYSRDEIVGKHFSELKFLQAENFPTYTRVLNALMKGEIPKSFEATWCHKDGTTFFAEIHVGLLLEDGKSVGLQAIARDVTERKRAEEKLKESEEKYRTLTDNVNVGVYRNTAGPKGRFIEANPAIVKMFGYDSREEFLTITVAELYQDPREREKFNKKISEKGFVRNEELQLMRKNGTPLIGSVSAVAVRDEKGRISHYDGIIEDITDQKEAEEALRSSEAKYRGLFENVLEGIYQTSPDGQIISANPALVTMLGYESETELHNAHSARDLYADPNQRESILKRLEKEGELRNAELVLKHKDGHYITVLENVRAVRDKKGSVQYYEGTLTNISERKRAEEKLKESEEKYRTLVEQSLQGILIAQGIPPHFVFVNSTIARISGYTIEELLSLPPEGIAAIVHPDDRAFFFERYRNRLEGHLVPSHYEFRIIRKDGSVRWLELYSTRIEYGGNPAVQAVFVDITERKRVETQLKNLFEASRRINSTMDTGEIFKFVSDSVQKLVGFDSFTMYVVSEDRTVTPAYSSDGRKVSPLEYGEGVIGQCIETKEPLFLGNVHEHEIADSHMATFASHIVVPLVIETDCVGALHISRLEKNAYDQSDLSALQSLSEVISSALRNSRLYDEIKVVGEERERRIEERTRKIEILLNTKQNLQKEQNWEKGLRTIVESMAALGFERCGVILVNSMRRALEFYIGRGIELLERGTSISLKNSEYFGVKCVLEKRTIHVKAYNPEEGKQVTSETRSFVWVPIIVQDEAFAALAADNVRSQRLVTEEDVKDLEILAGMCAAFIDRTRIQIEPVPENVLQTEFKHWLDPMEGYIIIEKKPEKSLEIFCDLVTHGIPGFAILRTNPGRFRRKYELTRTPMLWLSRSEAENTINPNDLSKLLYIIEEFTKKSEESVILLEGLEYLITQINFEAVLKYMQELHDTVIINNSRLIIPLHRDTLTPREYFLLEKEFAIL
jgi:PAS domain S-box-containing protein